MELRNNPETQKIHPTSFSSSPSKITTLFPPATLDLHQVPEPTSPNPGPGMIRYRECQRNHAAHLGGQVVDGCGEFMPAGDEDTPLALKCAACDCHRNFHRRETEGESTITTTAAPPPQPPHLLPPPPHTAANCYISFNTSSTPRPQKHPTVRPSLAGSALTQHQNHHSRAPVMMAFGGGGGGGGAAESSSEEYRAAAMAAEQYGGSKKRFRTKFTAEQKEKMMEFAEKIGWRIQKQEDAEVQRFCAELGIKRQVFKVWLHNNKQAIKRKQSSSPSQS